MKYVYTQKCAICCQQPASCGSGLVQSGAEGVRWHGRTWPGGVSRGGHAAALEDSQCSSFWDEMRLESWATDINWPPWMGEDVWSGTWICDQCMYWEELTKKQHWSTSRTNVCQSDGMHEHIPYGVPCLLFFSCFFYIISHGGSVFPSFSMMSCVVEICWGHLHSPSEDSAVVGSHPIWGALPHGDSRNHECRGECYGLKFHLECALDQWR